MFWKSFNVALAPLSVLATLQFQDTHQLGDFFVLDVSKRQRSRGCLRRWDRDKIMHRHMHIVTRQHPAAGSGVLSEPRRRRRSNSRL